MDRKEEIEAEIKKIEAEIEDLEAAASEMIHVEEKKVEAKFGQIYTLTRDKYEVEKETLGQVTNVFETWKSKRQDAKYKYKQTGEGKDTLQGIIENFKDAKLRFDEMKLIVSAFEDELNDFAKKKEKEMKAFIKEVESGKKKLINPKNKEIKGLRKELLKIY